MDSKVRNVLENIAALLSHKDTVSIKELKVDDDGIMFLLALDVDPYLYCGPSSVQVGFGANELGILSSDDFVSTAIERHAAGLKALELINRRRLNKSA